jgi:hypothetical protein
MRHFHGRKCQGSMILKSGRIAADSRGAIPRSVFEPRLVLLAANEVPGGVPFRSQVAR